jgi:hypothetical protein
MFTFYIFEHLVDNVGSISAFRITLRILPSLQLNQSLRTKGFDKRTMKNSLDLSLKKLFSIERNVQLGFGRV